MLALPCLRQSSTARQFLNSLSCRRQCLATWNLHPSIQEFTSTLAKRQPGFLVRPNDIRFLSKPREFYTLLLNMIRNAQSRIFLSSLYIGSSESELISTLDAALSRNPDLKLHLQLDLNRSTRPGQSSTATILLPLLRRFPSQVHVSMFRSPALRGMAAELVPPRFNEGWGTWHAKIYGVDDDVVISGANLNKSYFTNRQDRYVHIKNQPQVAQYCLSFLETVSSFSFRLLPAGTSMPYSSQYSMTRGDYTLHWLKPDTHPHRIHKKAQSALTMFQASHHSKLSDSVMAEGRTEMAKLKPTKQPPSFSESIADPRVMLFPVIQAGQFNICEEEAALQSLFRYLSSFKPAGMSLDRPLLDLTSGYFGLYKLYLDLILKSNIDTRIVCSAPKANGFYGSNGISGRIPEGYTYLEQRFMKAVLDAGRSWVAERDGEGRGVQLSEWERDGWTYHAKGIWLSPSPQSPPILTMFGSTNLNSRSAHLDTELSFIMAIPSEQQTTGVQSTERRGLRTPSFDGSTEADASLWELRRQLQSEVQQIREHTDDWKGGKRHVRPLTKLIVHLVKGML
ncbi:hypothetical protein AMATHDRAFT_196706 [Amanita thiersii Skay4041]|uniref:CDP-diacylglycerol--glycerol-3-phosphate 3-phosphatidyltransferase n=1 Tax=Amanita thiersii Skay4041 TaxID=703135 RepID=A0A2A9NBJ1_9AGAR|nr:hypothetical protein AMATHDRAFT_196706 [Amanita thiersii Skay4041]